MRRLHASFACGALLIATACSPSSDAPAETAEGAQPPRDPGSASGAEPWLVDEAVERGLAFTYASGARGELLMPEIMGGGAALIDADGDGDLDAYVTQGGELRAAPDDRPPNRLFANDGAGRFTDVTPSSGAGDRGYGMGVACGDVDGDGRVDLYVTNVGADALLGNRGEMRFQDVTTSAGIAADGWGTSAAFLDADADGDLDLYVTRYIVWDADGELACSNDMGSADYCSPTAYDAPALDLFFENLGRGVFRDASAASGVQAAAANGLGVVCADFDADGAIDVFVANDQDPDLLWRGRGDATFEDGARTLGVALDHDGRAKAGMGVAVADVDRDGDEDLLVCNLNGESDSFFENRGGWFSDRTHRAGLATRSRSSTRFGVAWLDVDQDGRLDLIEANGRVMRRRPVFAEGDDYAEPNLLFRGVTEGRFEEVPHGGLRADAAATSRGLGVGDVDGDGALDVLIVNRDAPAALLMNRAPRRGHALVLDVRDANGAPALGARVELIRADGPTERREVRAASSYLSSSDARVHVGLGRDARLPEVRVTWPEGATRTWRDLAAGETHALRP